MRTFEIPMAGLYRIWILVPALFLMLLLIATTAGAQDAGTDFDPYPLRPAETSSPRDTLRSFLTNVDEVIAAWRRGEFNAKSARGLFRAMETLDLSTTPHSDAWGVRTERVLMLKEILDRIELPPDSAIPGDSEVADDTLKQWMIPDTRITVARIGDGPRAGEFLFSADTVERLHRYYANARHLPYKPGVPVGIYEEWSRSDRTDRAREKQARNRLKPVDTSNPRSTLQLRYETTPEQLRYVLTRLRELLLGHPMVDPDPARVRFVGFGAYSLDLDIHAYVRCVDQNAFLAVQEDLFLRMADIVQEAGSGFAFPSQTTYFAHDTGLDAELRDKAETQVGHRRFAGKLPFPEFEEEQRQQLEDILDYPPQGSPDYKPREDK
jgi:hypothetical protein